MAILYQHAISVQKITFHLFIKISVAKIGPITKQDDDI